MQWLPLATGLPNLGIPLLSKIKGLISIIEASKVINALTSFLTIENLSKWPYILKILAITKGILFFQVWSDFRLFKNKGGA